MSSCLFWGGGEEGKLFTYWSIVDLQCDSFRCIAQQFIHTHTRMSGLAKKFIQLVNTLLSQVLGENEKFVFYFYLKPNELFSQPYENVCVCVYMPTQFT